MKFRSKKHQFKLKNFNFLIENLSSARKFCFNGGTFYLNCYPKMRYDIRLANKSSMLDILAEKYGTDKGGRYLEKPKPFTWPSHSYCDFYSSLFDEIKDDRINVLECGIGTNNPYLPSNMTINGQPGASLYMWREFFPNANIYGVDLDEAILFQDDRIQTFQMDQTSNLSINKALSSMEVDVFDVVIDDGLHTYSAGKNLFVNLFDCLTSGGFYIIEDVGVSDTISYIKFFSRLNIKFQIVEFVSDGSLLDDRLILIKKQ